MKLKKRLTVDQEFERLKLVMDKFLWVGFLIMLFGLFQIYNANTAAGLYLVVGGAAILVVFMTILIREYEITR